MKVREVCAAIEEWAPPALAYEWDHLGLAVGRPDWEVAGVLAALTVTREVFEAARGAGANLIVSHHPLIWDPLKTLCEDDAHTALCVDLVRDRVACFAAHTNLDMAPGGVNDTLADLLGLVDLQPLQTAPQAGSVKLVTFVPEAHLPAVREAVCAAGAGVIGDYTHCTFSAPGTGTFVPGEAAKPFTGERGQLNEEPELRFETLVPRPRLGVVLAALMAAHPYEEPAYDIVPLDNRGEAVGLGLLGTLPETCTLGAFAERARNVLGLSHVRVVGDLEKPVRTVAVLGGSGGSHVAAVPGKADVYLTGDIGYHDALAAQARGLALIDAGHNGTERCIVPVLAGFLQKRFEGLPIVTHHEADPFQAITG